MSQSIWYFTILMIIDLFNLEAIFNSTGRFDPINNLLQTH